MVSPCIIAFSHFYTAGVNDAVEHAKELAELLNEWGRGHHVNLIPFNPVEGTEYRRPYRKAVSFPSFSLDACAII